MSDELKARLTELLEFYREGEYLSEHSLANATPNTIKAIAQAYKDAGYLTIDIPDSTKIKLQSNPVAKNNMQLMTSQEWVARFTQELDADKHLMTPGAYKHALEIAKRAAGVK